MGMALVDELLFFPREALQVRARLRIFKASIPMGVW
jgi:hypothetical protein